MLPLQALREIAREQGYRLALFAAVIPRLLDIPKRRRWVVEQLYVSGIQTLRVVLLVGLFMGMIVALQTGIELVRLGQQDQVGTIVALSMAREMGPFTTGIVLAATVGSALAAELGTMAVSDEIAALDVLSIDHVSFLVMPRVLGLAVMAPLLTILCDAIGIIGGGLIADVQLHVSWSLYADSAIDALSTPGKLISLPTEVYSGLMKSFVFGIIIATISCASGLQTRGGALGVGRATRRAVRDSIVAIIIANYFMTSIIQA
jgi:phospholipid/cholesterol/gamma-HCH transport system permease protein